MSNYPKLVRDKIPEIIRSEGRKVQIHTADEREYRTELYKKLQEEVAELTVEPSMEESADVLEVLKAVHALEGWTDEEVEKVRLAKHEKRGGFEKRIIVEAVGE